MRKHVGQIAAAAGLLLLLTWLALRSTSPTVHNVQVSLNLLDQVAAAESALHRDLLAARTGILNNYDPIVAEMQAIRDAIPRLRNSAPADPRIFAAIDRLQVIVDQQEAETERFKSRNALLRNSLAYFQLFSTRLSADTTDPVLATRVSNLTAAMLHLTLDSAPPVMDEVDAAVHGIPLGRFSAADADQAMALLSHARLLRNLLPEVDQGLKALFALPSQEQQETIRALVGQRGVVAERKASRYRYALYGVSIVLVMALIMLGLRLEMRARHMRRRADIEHVIAGISMRFINARSELVPLQVEQALEELSQCLRADCAYFIAGGAAARTYRWCRAEVRFPDDWPSGTLTARSAVRDQPGGMMRARRPDAEQPNGLPAAPGAGDWFCISAIGSDTAEGLLGFESLRGALRLSDEESGLWRMAFDSIAHAVERELLEAERRQLETKLQQARRMETIGTLASGIAHNFNNVVGAILGYAEMAQAHVRAGGKAAESLVEIRRAGERARDLIDQILSFGRRSDSSRQRIRLETLITEAKALLVATLPSTVRFEIRPGAVDGVVLPGNTVQLQQVLVNICNNAIQAIDGEGAITLESRITDHANGGPTALDRLAPGTYAVITVADNGRGMDQATRARIFELFFTTREEGNGLGLATALEIVRSHGGDIFVESVVGAGARFQVWLPCSRPRSAEPAGMPEAMIRGNGETVLIYEPDQARLMKQEEIVAALGYEPVGFTQIGALIDVLEAGPHGFDVALLNSTQTAASLHEAAPDVPIILAVTSAAGLAAPALAAAGVTEIIGFPLNSAELADALMRCVNAWNSRGVQAASSG